MTEHARVALSSEFMAAFSKLPTKIQKKTREFVEKFQANPKSPGIHLEHIQVARDSKVRSARIDQSYRAIIIQPPKDDVFLCVWVDHHDAAYAWAKNKVFEVNPKSGSFQLFELVEGQPELETPAPTSRKVKAAKTPSLFEAFDDEDLMLSGVPEPLLTTVRTVKTDEEYEQLAPFLPPDAAEMLYLLAAGYDLMEAFGEAERSKASDETPIDREDFTTALERPESQQSFRIVTDEDELEAMLDAPLEQWRIFLHPSQSKLVRMKANGPVRVLGGAGTGKTVVLMHRAKFLAENVFKGDSDRILVTTYTRNLAGDLAHHLKSLCPDEAKRIEVTNLHAWALAFLKKEGAQFTLVENQKDGAKEDLFRQAADEFGDDSLPWNFYRDEWDQVVQAQDVASKDDYLSARRVGRGTRLSRRQRAKVWQVLEEYRRLLDANEWTEWQDVIREARLFIEKQELLLGYQAVLADEVQDFTPGELKLLRTIAPKRENDLFLVGDGHQRIYGKPVTLGSCGIEIRGRSKRLKLNYRTTAQVRDHAVALLQDCSIDDLDGGKDSMKGYHSLRSGPAPEVQHFEREADEAEFVLSTVRRWIDDGISPESICVASRTNSQVRKRYVELLEADGIATVIVQRDPVAEAKRSGVRLATMHRMKGLEFSRVLLAGVQEGKVPLDVGSFSDDAERASHALQERCLMYVACTRARDELVITGFGGRSPFL